MNRKVFKYESRTKKPIRIKDILMFFAVLALCIVTLIATEDNGNRNKKTSTESAQELPAEDIKSTAHEPDLAEAKLEDYSISSNAGEEIAYEILPELVFQKPVEGTIIKMFSLNELIYSETMDDWRPHIGIDIACPLGTSVLSAERGVVKSVKYDINYGHVVSVESGEFTIVYTSLSSDVAVKQGQEVSKGDVIGVTSDSCVSEICDEPHIHIEMKKNGEYVNPADYINFK